MLSAGLLSISFQAKLYPTLLMAALAAFVVLAYKLKIFKALAVFVLGALWATLYASWVLSAALEKSIEGQEVQVLGTIIGVPKLASRYTQFNFNVESLHFDSQQYPSPRKVRLRWYGKDRPELSTGARWRLLVKLKKPHGSANPATFDYEAWLFSKRIRATGYVRKPATAQLIEPTGKNGIDHFRARYARWLEGAELKQSAIITALAVGLRQEMSDAQWETLQNTGTNHLVAISGLHIGLVAGFLYFIGSFLWRHTLLAKTLYPTQKAAWFLALVGGALYAALAGFAIPTKRAMIMLIAVAALYFVGKRPGPWFSLGLVLALVLLFDPLAPLSAGFWLSFLAVGFILLALRVPTIKDSEHFEENPFKQFQNKLIKRTIAFSKVQWALLVGLAPVLLLTFQKVSLVSIIANFVAVPVIGIVVVPLTLIGVFFFSISLPNVGLWFTHCADFVLNAGWPYLQRLANTDIATWQHTITWPVALCAIVGSIGLLLHRFGKLRWFCAFAWLPVIVATPDKPDKGEIWLSVLDVGQGLAVVVQTQNHTLLYDAGPRFEGGFDAGKSIVVPYLRHSGTTVLSKTIISHDNIDHSGGLAAVLKSLTIEQLVASKNEGIADSLACISGEQWQWDSVQFEFLHPNAGSTASGNNASCVLKISSEYGDILLTGDIEKAAEKILLQNPAVLKSDVLVVPHHGSATSSNEAFVEAVSAEYAVVSAGYLNRFGHPKAKVKLRYETAGTQLYNTADHGRVLFKITASGITPSTYRQETTRYWN